ncbi:hypothetical protein V2O64_23120 [Verrucomicrobiaceae bacterium 227]
MKKHLSLLAVFVGGALIAPADERPSGEALPRFLQQFDTNDDGLIDVEERQAIADLRSTLRELQRKSIDANQDGKIKRDEVEAAREVLRIKIEERRLEMFRKIAGEDDLITIEEYATIPGSETLPDFVFEGIFDRLDTDGSGDISVEEFFHRLTPHREPAKRRTRNRN